MVERAGGTTKYYLFQAYAIMVVLMNATFQLTAQFSLPGVNYERDPMIASAYALSLGFYLSPVIILAAMFDLYSRRQIQRQEKQSIESRRGKSWRAWALLLSHFFILGGGIVAIGLMVAGIIGSCGTAHRFTLCVPNVAPGAKHELRWQTYYAFAHFSVLTVLVGILVVYFMFGSNDLSVQIVGALKRRRGGRAPYQQQQQYDRVGKSSGNTNDDDDDGGDDEFPRDPLTAPFASFVTRRG